MLFFSSSSFPVSIPPTLSSDSITDTTIDLSSGDDRRVLEPINGVLDDARHLANCLDEGSFDMLWDEFEANGNACWDVAKPEPLTLPTEVAESANPQTPENASECEEIHQARNEDLGVTNTDENTKHPGGDTEEHQHLSHIDAARQPNTQDDLQSFAALSQVDWQATNDPAYDEPSGSTNFSTDIPNVNPPGQQARVAIQDPPTELNSLYEPFDIAAQVAKSPLDLVEYILRKMEVEYPEGVIAADNFENANLDVEPALDEPVFDQDICQNDEPLIHNEIPQPAQQSSQDESLSHYPNSTLSLATDPTDNVGLPERSSAIPPVQSHDGAKINTTPTASHTCALGHFPFPQPSYRSPQPPYSLESSHPPPEPSCPPSQRAYPLTQYYTLFHPSHSLPQPSYPLSQPSDTVPEPSYTPPEPSYPPSEQSYPQAPEPVYNLSQPSHALPQPSYIPKQSYSLPERSYSAPEPVYSFSQPSHTLPQPSYTHSQPSYPLPQPSHTIPQPSYTHSQPSYTLPQPSHPLLQPHPPRPNKRKERENEGFPSQPKQKARRTHVATPNQTGMAIPVFLSPSVPLLPPSTPVIPEFTQGASIASEAFTPVTATGATSRHPVPYKLHNGQYVCTYTGPASQNPAIECGQTSTTRDNRARNRHLATHAAKEESLIADGKIDREEAVALDWVSKIVVTCDKPGCTFEVAVWRTDNVRKEHYLSCHPGDPMPRGRPRLRATRAPQTDGQQFSQQFSYGGLVEGFGTG